MKRLIILCSLTICVVVASASVDDKATAGLETDTWNTYVGWNFRVSIPKAMSVTKRDPKLDFFSYWFYPEGTDSAILYAYAGNHPSFLDNVPVGSRIERIEIGWLHGESVEWIDDGGLFYRETMIRLQGQFQVPQFVYFRYGKLTKEQKEIVDAIIQSTRPGSE